MTHPFTRNARPFRRDLPPPRNRKPMRPVSPPFSKMPLHRFNYYIAVLAVLLAAFYAYRMLQWKADEAPSAAEWRQPGQWTAARGGEPTVEDRINELASALGVPSKELASAIAAAVREYVPPASLSSVAAHQTGSAVQFLMDPSGAAASKADQTPVAGATRGIASVFEAR
ncbi:hypothetical protein A0H81_07188 [Grifola frondosa]|uniref:Uncharacterized protein n=1 Tax=Grifola frondosa TaxID=5627 RepID=A0A1C7M8M5_GRIFR|nr:hypothetical protein A0H81_07188 [Grifola frondosa]